ncbi:MAG: ammonia channel protein, partial [Actinobacteria bacterium]|nr:ammonia channel protein [Actinomycetota bacterium]
CYIAVSLKPKIGYDDSLDVVGVHMVGGIVGALLTGVFATLAINPAGADGAAYGHAAQIVKQAIAVGATLGYSFVVTLGILKVTDLLVGIRVSDDDEMTGLDLSQHAESAYTFIEVGTLSEHTGPKM